MQKQIKTISRTNDIGQPKTVLAPIIPAFTLNKPAVTMQGYNTPASNTKSPGFTWLSSTILSNSSR